MQQLLLSLPHINSPVLTNVCSIGNLVSDGVSLPGSLPTNTQSTPVLPPIKELLFNGKQLPPLQHNQQREGSVKANGLPQYSGAQQNGASGHGNDFSASAMKKQRAQMDSSGISRGLLNPFDQLSSLLTHIESSSSDLKPITGHEAADKIIRDNGDYSLQLKEIFGSFKDIHLLLLNWPMVQYSQDIPIGEVMRELVSYIEYRDLEKLNFLIDKIKRQLDLVKYWKDNLGHLCVEKLGNGRWHAPGEVIRETSAPVWPANSAPLGSCESRLASPTPSVSLGAGIVSGLSGASTSASSRSVSFSVPAEKRVGYVPEHVGELKNEYFTDLIVPNWFIVVRDPQSMSCLQCGSRGTSEWRSGPLGRKSMCNACGIWYMKLKQRFGEQDAAVIMEYRRLTNRQDDRRVPKKFEVPMSEVEKVRKAIRARVIEYLNEVEIPTKTRRRALLHRGNCAHPPPPALG